jgi:hypothetical protein
VSAGAGTGGANGAFWATARRRHALFFLVGIGWLVAGLPLWWLVRALLPGAEPLMAGLIALATWAVLWWWTGQRLTQMRCAQCANRAFANPWFLMRHARCQVCGTSPRASAGPHG